MSTQRQMMALDRPHRGVKRTKHNPSEGGLLVIAAAAVIGGIALFGPKTPCEINKTTDPTLVCTCLDAPNDQVAMVGCYIRQNPIMAAGIGAAAILLWKMR